MVFISEKPWHNHRESKLFLNHVDLSVIELQALKKKKVPMVEMIWQKLRRK